MNPNGILHHPTVFNLGPIELTGFGLAVLAAFAVAQFVAQRELWRRGHDQEAAAMPDIVMAALIGTLIGAKSYYVVLTGDPGAFFSRGGFVFWGGFIGAVLLCWGTIRYKKLPFLRIADACGIAIAAGYAVGRTGCWAVGDDYGRPWNSPFAAQFPEGAPPSTVSVMSSQFGVQFPADMPGNTVVSVHPTQIYEVVMGFLMFALLWKLRKATHRDGWLFGMYCILAGIERFIVEFFRAKDDHLAVGLTSAQVIAMSIIVVGIGFVISKRGQTGTLAAA